MDKKTSQEKEVPDITKLFSDLDLDKDKEINILLLGTKGVGKSTFINALANYVSYKSLENAEKHKLLTLVPSSFNIVDKDFKDHEVEADANDEETCEVTSEIESYVLTVDKKKTKLRIIDTPGFDNQASLEDVAVCDDILGYLGQLKELHAICCLFPVRETTINKFLQNHIKEILKRFDESITKNLIFIFTNAHANHYSPNIGMLRKFFGDSEIEGDLGKISVENENIFCLENDSYRYLAARDQQIEFSEDTRKCYIDTWNRSYNECFRLIEYVAGSSTSKPLKPYDLEKTTSVVQASNLIYKFLQPLIDILDMIKNNITVKEVYKEKINAGNSVELNIPSINLRVTSLSHPITVCISSKCATPHSVGVVQNWLPERCCDLCLLKSPRTLIDSPALSDCDKMDEAGVCKCSCLFSEHMHVYYTTKTELKKVAAEANLNLTSTDSVLNIIEDEIAEFKQEMVIIIKSAAQFVHFLQNNALGACEDPYEKYINYLIEREQSMEAEPDQNNIDQMCYVLQQYAAMKKAFEDRSELQTKLGNEISLQTVSPNMILQTVESLYTLKCTGSKIKELIDSQLTARSKEFQETSRSIDLEMKRTSAGLQNKMDIAAAKNDWEMIEKSDCNQRKWQYRGGNRRGRNRPRQRSRGRPDHGVNQCDKGNQGNWQYQGNRGYQGDRNYQGNRTNQEYQGNRNNQRNRNSQDDQGYQANKNNQGDQGYKGNRNYQGNRNNQGNQSNRNNQGNRNNEDDQGYQGNRNNQGNQGFRGNRRGGGGNRGGFNQDNQTSNRQAPPPYTPFPEQSNQPHQGHSVPQQDHFNSRTNVPHIEVNVFQGPPNVAKVNPSQGQNLHQTSNLTASYNIPVQAGTHFPQANPQQQGNRPSGASYQSSNVNQSRQPRSNVQSGNRQQRGFIRSGVAGSNAPRSNNTRPQTHTSSNYYKPKTNKKNSDSKDCVIC